MAFFIRWPDQPVPLIANLKKPTKCIHILGNQTKHAIFFKKSFSHDSTDRELKLHQSQKTEVL